MTLLYVHPRRNRMLGLRYGGFSLFAAAVGAGLAVQSLPALPDVPLFMAALLAGLVAATVSYRACLRMRIERDNGFLIVHNAFSTASIPVADVQQGEFVEESTGPARHVGVIVSTEKGERWMRMMPLALEDAAEFKRRLWQSERDRSPGHRNGPVDDLHRGADEPIPKGENPATEGSGGHPSEGTE